jgi:hypothetical protein
MPKYVIERELAGIGNITHDQVLDLAQKSCSVLDRLGPKIQWLHSYVTADTILLHLHRAQRRDDPCPRHPRRLPGEPYLASLPQFLFK